MLYEQCKNTVKKIAQINDREKIKNKKISEQYILNKPKVCSFYTFTKQVSQHFHKTFILSCNWSQFYILLFYFDL